MFYAIWAFIKLISYLNQINFKLFIMIKKLFTINNKKTCYPATILIYKNYLLLLLFLYYIFTRARIFVSILTSC